MATEMTREEILDDIEDLLREMQTDYDYGILSFYAARIKAILRLAGRIVP